MQVAQDSTNEVTDQNAFSSELTNEDQVKSLGGQVDVPQDQIVASGQSGTSFKDITGPISQKTGSPSESQAASSPVTENPRTSKMKKSGKSFQDSNSPISHRGPSKGQTASLPPTINARDQTASSGRIFKHTDGSFLQKVKSRREDETTSSPSSSSDEKLVFTGVCIVFIVTVLYKTIYNIPAGSAGVVKRLGKVQEDYIPPGFHLAYPFIDEVIIIDVRISSVGSDMSTIAFSQDLQQVQTTLSLQYSLQSSLTPKAYENIGTREAIEINVISKAIEESLKAVTSNFTAEELIQKRNFVKGQIRLKVEDFIQEATNQKGLDQLIVIANLAITEFGFSEQFNKAIEAKVQAEQKALQAKNEKQRIVIESEAAREKVQLAADAVAYQTMTLAEAEANKTLALAEAKAKALALEGEALKANPEIIKLRKIEQWDGILPKFALSEALPMFNMGSVDQDRKKRSASENTKDGLVRRQIENLIQAA